MSKKNKKILITIVISILVILILALLLHFSIKAHQNLNCSSPEEALQFYNTHAGLLNKVVEELSPLPNRVEVTKFEIIPNIRSDWDYYCRKFYVLNTTSHKVTITDEQLKELDDFTITSAVWGLKPDKIMKQNDCIVFQQFSGIGFGSGLSYSPHKEPHSEYVYKWVELKDGWFYYETS